MNTGRTVEALKWGLAGWVGVVLIAGQAFAADMTHKSGPFKGPKANTGYVISSSSGGKTALELSSDFKTPDTPDPHWQVVDSQGTVYLLQKIAIKDNRMNRKIVLPGYIKNVAKVVIWCAWAETNLGEASFEKPIMVSAR